MQAAQSVAQDLLKGRDMSHDYDHGARTAKIALESLEELLPDATEEERIVTYSAAIVHDVIDSKYVGTPSVSFDPSSVREAEAYLKKRLSDIFLPHIVNVMMNIIDKISWHNRETTKPFGNLRLEAMRLAVRDGDLVDGAVWQRCIAYNTQMLGCSDEEAERRCCALYVERIAEYTTYIKGKAARMQYDALCKIWRDHCGIVE